MMKFKSFKLMGTFLLGLTNQPQAQQIPLIHPRPSVPIPTERSRAGLSPSFFYGPEKLLFSPARLDSICRRLENDRRRIYFFSDGHYGMNLALKGLYTNEGLLFFKMTLSNHSNLDYETDSIRFFIVDHHPSTASFFQPLIGISPLFIRGNTMLVRANSSQSTTIVLPAFTLPEGKRLIIGVDEKHGGRHLHLTTDNNTLLRCRLI